MLPVGSYSEDWSLHIQDLVNLSIGMGYPITEIEYDPKIGDPITKEVHSVYSKERRDLRLKTYLENYTGMLHVCNPYHMVAWDKHHVFDSRGYIESIDKYDVMSFYIIFV